MNPIVINGTVLCDNITGIPRYVYENVVRLDKLLEGTGLDVRIAYRDDGRPLHLPELKNIRLVPLKAVKYFYNMAVLPAYLRREHAFFVGFASDMLMTRRSVVVLHDIRPLVMDTDRGFFRFKFWVHCLSTKWFARRVFTVSDDQRHLISKKLGIMICIHMDPIAVNDETVNKYREFMAQIIREYDESFTFHDFRVVDGRIKTNFVFDLVNRFVFFSIL